MVWGEIKMAVDGTLAGITYGAAGTVTWELAPIYIEHPRWFRHELQGASGGD